MQTTIDLTHLTPEEVLLEDVRLMILGGILLTESFDRDDLPIADRIAAANEHLPRRRRAPQSPVAAR